MTGPIFESFLSRWKKFYRVFLNRDTSSLSGFFPISLPRHLAFPILMLPDLTDKELILAAQKVIGKIDVFYLGGDLRYDERPGEKYWIWVDEVMKPDFFDKNVEQIRREMHEQSSLIPINFREQLVYVMMRRIENKGTDWDTQTLCIGSRQIGECTPLIYSREDGTLVTDIVHPTSFKRKNAGPRFIRIEKQ